MSSAAIDHRRSGVNYRSNLGHQEFFLTKPDRKPPITGPVKIKKTAINGSWRYKDQQIPINVGKKTNTMAESISFMFDSKVVDDKKIIHIIIYLSIYFNLKYLLCSSLFSSSH